MDGGRVLLLRKTAGGKNVLGPEKDDTKSSARKITQLEGGGIGVNGLVTVVLVTGELNDTAHDRHGTWVM